MIWRMWCRCGIWYPDTLGLRHFGPKKLGPKCLNISDLGPKCPMDTSDLGPKCPDTSDLKVRDTSDLEFLVYFSVTTNMFGAHVVHAVTQV